MRDIEDLEDIKTFVDGFYGEIQKDDLLAPVFALRVEGGNWEPHLKKMYSFWNTVLFHERSYKGNPFARHIDLPVTPEHFSRWVSLFNQTIDKHFEGDRATDAKERVGKMAILFMSKIEHIRSHPNFKPLF